MSIMPGGAHVTPARSSSRPPRFRTFRQLAQNRFLGNAFDSCDTRLRPMGISPLKSFNDPEVNVSNPSFEPGVRPGQLYRTGWPVGNYFSGYSNLYLVISPTEKLGVWEVMLANGDVERWWEDGILGDQLVSEPEGE